MWATIHYICLAAPSNLSETDKNNYKNFFSILPAIMPCQACGIHLAENYNTLPIDGFLSTNQDLFKWSVDLHNIVNRQLGKSEISVEDAKQTWTVNYPRLLFPNESQSMSNNYDNNNKNDTKSIYFKLTITFGILIVLLLIILSYIAAKLYKKTRK